MRAPCCHLLGLHALLPALTLTSAVDLFPPAAGLPLCPQDPAVVRKLSERMPDIGRKVEYLLNTGNLVSKSGLDLSQVSGFTVVAEKLNFFRYISHFRWGCGHTPRHA